MGRSEYQKKRVMKSAASRAIEGEPPPDVTQPDFGTKGDTRTTMGSSEKPLKWKQGGEMMRQKRNFIVGGLTAAALIASLCLVGCSTTAGVETTGKV
jgi:hypothetical protein